MAPATMMTIAATVSNNSSAISHLNSYRLTSYGVLCLARPSYFRSDLPFLVLVAVCNEHRDKRHRERQAEQHRTMEYLSGNCNDLVRRPLQGVSPFSLLVVGCNL